MSMMVRFGNVKVMALCLNYLTDAKHFLIKNYNTKAGIGFPKCCPRFGFNLVMSNVRLHFYTHTQLAQPAVAPLNGMVFSAPDTCQIQFTKSISAES